MRTRSVPAHRYQPRLSFDERMGELWTSLMTLPDEARKTELMFLVQLGFTVKRALANGALIPSTGTNSHAMAASTKPLGQSKRFPAGLDEKDIAVESAALLDGFNLDDNPAGSA